METEFNVESTGSAPAVELPSFSGPLDLLLHLVRKNRMSIYDIPIAKICDQYHAYLADMQVLDLEMAGEFLWMASWLLQLKSRELLPGSEDGAGEDAKQELVERLLEYRRIKELASMLYELDVVRKCLWQPKTRVDLEPAERSVDWEDVDLRLLAESYLTAMQRFEAAHPPPLQVIPLRFTVEEKMKDLASRVQREKVVPLVRTILRGAEAEEVVTVIVAVLELVRVGTVSADQQTAFAEVFLRARSVRDGDAILQYSGRDDGE
ncbi:MAG: segregation/condensation protein A [bacterium]|nr:segregation/condensation protein A [bacterium]